MNSNFRQQPPFPLKKQAEAIASKGRFGDSTLVHMNPMEVDVLRSMTPNNQLTINPDTGQPEAFLPLLLALGGGLLGAGGGITALGALGGSVGLAALGSGIGTTIETGSLEEGIKAGLISGVLGGVGGRLFEGFGAAKDVATGVGQTTGQLGAEAGKQTAAEIAKTVGTENLITSTIPSAIPTTAAQSTSQMLAQEAAKSAALQPAVTAGTQEAVKQNIGQRLTEKLAGATVQDALGTAAAGLTGEAMTDQFNLMNMPLPKEEEKEPFYQEVRPNDRGVRFRQSNTNPAGTSEFDYFSNPFSYSGGLGGPLLTGMKEGGVVGNNVRGFQEGGGIGEPYFGPNFDPFNPTGKYRPTSMAVPSYFRDPMGTGSGAAAAADQLGLTDALGNRQFTLQDVVNTQQIYTPRADSPAITLGSRGFADAPVIDYNQRLLGDATRTFTTQEQIANPDYDPNAVAASTTTGTGSGTGGSSGTGGVIPDRGTTGSGTQARTGTTQIVDSGSEFNETFGMGEGVVSDLTTGQPDLYGMDSFVPVGAIMENLPGAYDPESGYMLPTGFGGLPPMEVGTFGPGDGLAPAADEADFGDPFNPFQGGVAVAPDVVGFDPVSNFMMPQDDMGGFDPVVPVMDFAPVDFSSQMMGEPSMAPIDFSSQMMGEPLMDFSLPPEQSLMDFAPVAPVMDFAPPPMNVAPPPMDFGLPPVAFMPPPMDFNVPPVGFTPPPVGFTPPPVDFQLPAGFATGTMTQNPTKLLTNAPAFNPSATPTIGMAGLPNIPNFDIFGGMKRGGLTG